MKRTKPCFIIVRHGESLTNVHRVLHKRVSDPSVWLTELGHRQAEQAGEFIALSLAQQEVSRVRVMRSTYLRAQQTSNHIIEKIKARCPSVMLDAKDLERFRELEFGYAGADGLPAYVHEYANMQRFQKHKFFAPRYGGESPAHMEPRIRSGIAAIYRDFKENNIEHFIVVCHGLTMRVIIKAIMDYDISWYENEPNPGNCSVRVIDNGNDMGYMFPNETGQWDPEWTEPPENYAKLNPQGLFFSVEQMNELIALQAQMPDVMDVVANKTKLEPKTTATELMEVARAYVNTCASV